MGEVIIGAVAVILVLLAACLSLVLTSLLVAVIDEWREAIHRWRLGR